MQVVVERFGPFKERMCILQRFRRILCATIARSDLREASGKRTGGEGQDGKDGKDSSKTTHAWRTAHQYKRLRERLAVGLFERARFEQPADACTSF